MVGLNYTFGMYPVSQLKVFGRFKRGGSLKIFVRKTGGGFLEIGGSHIILRIFLEISHDATKELLK